MHLQKPITFNIWHPIKHKHMPFQLHQKCPHLIQNEPEYIFHRMFLLSDVILYRNYYTCIWTQRKFLHFHGYVAYKDCLMEWLHFNPNKRILEQFYAHLNKILQVQLILHEYFSQKRDNEGVPWLQCFVMLFSVKICCFKVQLHQLSITYEKYKQFRPNQNCIF